MSSQKVPLEGDTREFSQYARVGRAFHSMKPIPRPEGAPKGIESFIVEIKRHRHPSGLVTVRVDRAGNFIASASQCRMKAGPLPAKDGSKCRVIVGPDKFSKKAAKAICQQRLVDQPVVGKLDNLQSVDQARKQLVAMTSPPLGEVFLEIITRVNRMRMTALKRTVNVTTTPRPAVDKLMAAAEVNPGQFFAETTTKVPVTIGA